MSKQGPKGVFSRRSERGNVFFTLFGAVAVVGVLGAGIMATMRGPLSTMVEVNRREQAKAEARVAASLILVNASDEAVEITCEGGTPTVDEDGYTEGPEPLAGGGPTGGGLLPAVGAPQNDPWGNAYGYCAWDHGPIPVDYGGCGRFLAGNLSTNNIAIAILSAGQNGTFDTTCVNDAGGYMTPNTSGGGDDIVVSMTYDQAISGSGGLWTLNTIDPSIAEITKDLDITGSATFSDALDLTGASAQLQLGISSMTLPDQGTLSACTAAEDGLIRINTTAVYGIEVCQNGTGWVPAGSVWVKGAGSDIYYASGSVGIGLTNPDDALDVVGTAEITSTLGVGGLTTSESLAVTNASTLNGTLTVTGTSALNNDVTITGSTSDNTADALTVTDLAASTIFTVQNDGNVGINNASPNDELDVNGAIDVTDFYKINGNITLDVAGDPALDTSILLGNNSGTAVTGDNNTLLGANTGATLVDGADNILVGEGVDVPAATTSDYLNIGDIIMGDMANNRLGIGFSSSGAVSSFNDTLEVNGSLDVGTSANITTSAVVGTTLDVGGTGTFTGAGNGLVVTNDVDIDGSVDVDGTIESDEYTWNGNDFTPATCAAGNFNRWDGSSWTCSADTGGGGPGAATFEEVLQADNDANGETAVGLGGVAIGATSITAGYELDVTGDTTISGNLAIGSTTMSAGLEVDVTGDVGATTYCDADGLNCFTTSQMNQDITEVLGVGNNAGGATDLINLQGLAIGSAVLSNGAADLEIDVTGDIGASQYCDEDGNNCFTAATVSGGGGGLWTDNTTHITYTSAGAHYINAGETLPAGFDANGTRVFFYPDKGAFRGGEITGGNNAWQDANIGTNSFAYGQNTEASGNHSVAIGRGNTSSGNDSTTLGSGLTASGTNSVAMGANTTASGWIGTAIGYQNTASGFVTTALGQGTIASGNYSTAIGMEVIAGNGTAGSGFGDHSMGIGLGDATGALPRITGDSSLGIFMGDQSGVDVTDSNTMALMGGELGIGTVSPVTGLDVDTGDAITMPRGTNAQRPGAPIDGMIRYNSTNDAYEVYSETAVDWVEFISNGEVVTGGAADPDRGIQFNSNGAFAADANFVYTSTGRLGLGTNTPEASIDIATSDALLLPRGNTAQRPGSPVNGMLRYHDVADKLEAYQGGAWQDILTDAAIAAGAQGQIQFNSGGAMGASANLYWDITNNRLGIGDPSPDVAFDVLGTIQIADGGEACNIAAHEGAVRYVSATDTYEVCANSGTGWQALVTDGTQLWTDNTTHITRENVHILDSGQTVDSASLNGGTTGMIWDTGNAALRAGRATAAQWDDANIGLYSAAFGQNSIASGAQSFAAGYGAQATGASAIALGESLTASGTKSFASGDTTNATGSYAIAMGQNKTASGNNSLSIGGGRYGTASGADAMAIGQNGTASGINSIALGHEVVAGDGTAGSGFGDYSMALGLGDASTGTYPQVTGDSSLGIFMGDQQGVDITAANTLSLMGGTMAIGDVVATTGGEQNLEFDVEGDIGAINYCDEDGNDCFAAADVGLGVWEDVSGTGDGPIRSSSGTINYANADFVFGSPQLDDDTDATHDSRMLFDKSSGAFRAGQATGVQWNLRGNQSAAFGLDTIALGAQSFAAGNGAQAQSTQSIALGNAAIASGSESFASGRSTAASGTVSTAMGRETTASGNYSTALGWNTTADGTSSTALGTNSDALDQQTFAAGYYATASGINSIALGTQATAGDGTAGSGAGDYSMAIGLGAPPFVSNYPQVTGDSSLGIFMGDQQNVDITTANLMALMGGKLMIDPDTTSATNTAPSGTLTVDVEGDIGAINYCDEDGNNCFVAADVGVGIWTDDTTHISYQSTHIIKTGQTLPAGFDADGTRMFFYPDKGSFLGGSIFASNDAWQEANIGSNSFAYGQNTQASGHYSTSLGQATTASGFNSTALGFNTTASGANSTAIGYSATASGTRGIAMGWSTASGSSSTAIGTSNTASGGYSTAIGIGNTASGEFSTALGRSATAGDGTAGSGNGDHSMAIGLGYDIDASAEGNPQVTGDYSLGLFMGDQSGVDVTAANTFSLMGGTMAIGDVAASTGGVQNLELDVTGDIGAQNYCDDAGNNCFVASDVGVGLWTAGTGDDIYYNSGTARVGVGTATPSQTFDVADTVQIYDGGTIVDNAGIIDFGQSGVRTRLRAGGNAGATGWFRITTGGNSKVHIIDDSGNFGIGRANDTDYADTQLDVLGTIKMDYGGEACDASREGAIHYSSGADTFYFCADQANGWEAVSLGSGVTEIDDLSDALADYATEHNLIMGRTSATALTAGAQNNVFIGESTGATTANSTAATDNNTALGYVTLSSLTSGNKNTAIGSWALRDNQSGSSNTALGWASLWRNTTGNENTALGVQALWQNSTGTRNTAVGNNALLYNAGNYNVGLGYDALYNYAGAGDMYNVAVGAQALRGGSLGSSGTHNTALGGLAGDSITTGSDNIFIGYDVDAPTATTSNYINIGGLITGDMATGDIAINGTAALTTPRGTTAQRPGTGVNGMIRYNSDTDRFEAYQAGTWQDIITSGGGAGLWTAGTGDDIYYNSGTPQVGIGTSSPVATLEISEAGSASRLRMTKADHSGNSWGMDFYAVTRGLGGIHARQTSSSGWSNADLAFRTKQSVGSTTLYESMTLTGNAGSVVGAGGGRLGIGETTPDAMLEIVPNGTVASMFMLSSVAANNGDIFNVEKAGDATFGGTGALTIHAGGTAERPGTGVNGMIRYNSDSDKFEGYQAGIWTDIITAGGTPADPNRGIQFNSFGTFAADANFVYTSAGDFIVGSYQLDDTTTGSEDDRVFFDVSKGSFRAGRATGTEWDDGNVGAQSVAFGLDTTASGNYSFAMGHDSTASGQQSTALGFDTIASGGQSIATGKDSIASGLQSMAMGNATTASGDNSIAIGSEAVAGDGTAGSGFGDYSMAIGLGDSATTPFPRVTGNSSLGIFMGDQQGVDVTAANTFAIVGATGGFGIGTVSPQAELDVAGTGALITPRGNTAQRPGTGVNGMIRYNSDTDKYEAYQAGAWQDIITTGGGANVWQAGTGDDIYYNSGTPQVGIGVTDPDVHLDVGGTLQIADGGETCAVALGGAIRYRSGIGVEYCDGASWKTLSSGGTGILLTISPPSKTDMDVTGPGAPATGTTVNFTVTNEGDTTTDPLSYSLDNTTNFNVVTDTCTGIALGQNGTCIIGITPQTSGDGLFSATLNIPHHNAPAAILQGTGSGFGCNPGQTGFGGVIVACDYTGIGQHLVINESGCDGSTNNPTCSGVDTATKQWATNITDEYGPLLKSDTDGAQNTVNAIAFGRPPGTLPAAEYCDALQHNSQTDWFLPATAHLQLAYANIASEFVATNYPTSYEWNGRTIKMVNMSTGSVSTSAPSADKTRNWLTRCMRVEGVALPSAQTDTTPEEIVFPTEFQTSAGVQTTSDTFTVTGITPGATISISGDASAEYSINAGAYGSAASTVSWGDTVTIRMDSPAIGSRAQADLTIGTETFFFSVITEGDCGGGGCGGTDKRVFVSSVTYNGNLGGLAGGDAKCQALADAAIIGGTWRAILSSSIPSGWAVNRMDYNWDRLVNMNGDVIADNPDDLWDGTIDNPVGYDETTAVSTTSIVYTGTLSSGLPNDQTCTDWGSTSGSADTGAASVAGGWVDNNTARNCNNSWQGNIYCAEVSGPTVVLTSTPASGSSMNVTGPGSPATGTEILFTIENTGSGQSGVLSAALSGGINFTITNDNCTGGTNADAKLDPAETCTIGATPQATSDGNYNDILTVTDATNSVDVDIALSGIATGFGVLANKWQDGDDAGDIHYSSGPVGIGTTDPDVDLDIAGIMRAIDDAAACTAVERGSIRYHSASNIAQLCDGSSWLAINTGAGGMWTAGTGNDIYYNSGTPQVGIGVTDPDVHLDVGGTLQIADGGEACAVALGGAIRYRSGIGVEYCDGASWKTLSSGGTGIVLTISPPSKTDMDVTGPGAPATGTTVNFTVTNEGDTTTDPLSYSLDNTTNFNVVTDTCTGIALGQNGTCTIGITPQTSGDGLFSATLNIPHHNAPAAILQGLGSSFGCNPGQTGWGGTVVQCDYAGAGNHLIVMDSGCDGTLSNPTCSGADTYLRRWSLNQTEDYSIVDDINDGDQNQVNAMAYGRAGGTLPAIEYCDALDHNTQTDWFLPSPTELQTAYTNISSEFAAQNYWTSAECGSGASDALDAGVVQMSTGNYYNCGSQSFNDKPDNHRVRCMRIAGVALPTAQTDTDPEDLTFATKFQTAASVQTTSDTLTVESVTANTAISLAGDASAEYQINGGAWGTAASTVTWGDTVTIRMDSPALSSRAQADLTIGAQTFSFSVITEGDCSGAGCSGIDKRIFVASGDIATDPTNTLPALDASCQSAADTAGLGGTWKVLASDTYDNPAEWGSNRIDYNWDRLVNMNGDVIATSPADLWDGTITNAINYDENGTIRNASPLSRTDSNGAFFHIYGTATSSATNNNWANNGGTSSWGSNRPAYCMEQTIGSIQLSSTPSSGTSMNVTGPGSPATGTEVIFTIQNTGTTLSAALSYTLSNSVNFQVTTDNCSGNTLAAAATCTMGVTPQASADGSYNGTLTVQDLTNNVDVDIGMSGLATGFGALASKWQDGDDPGDIHYSSGPVGIGTNDPEVDLDIAGIMRAIDDAATCGAVERGAIRFNSGSGIAELCDGSSWLAVNTGAGGMWTAGTGDDIYYNSGTPNVGIGTASPSHKLDVVGAIQISDNSEACAAAGDVGGIRFNGGAFEICQDHTTGWEPLAGAGGGGACNATETYNSAGTHNYTVPASFDTITIKLWGAGGGGGYEATGSGNTGGSSTVSSLSLVANGGVGGSTSTVGGHGSGGAGGTASGGDTNTNGNAGTDGVLDNNGNGASAPAGGGAGGVNTTGNNGSNGNAPGGGGSGGEYGSGANPAGGGGGSGAYVEKTYTPGTLTPSTVISDIVVGAGGDGNPGGSGSGGDGGTGRISITCVEGASPPSGATFTASLDDTPADYTGAAYKALHVNAAGDGIEFASTSAMIVPTGTTAQRPGTGTNGMIRYNSQTAKFEGYQSGSWQDIITAGGTAGGANTQVQYNSSGSFGGDAGFTYAAGTDTLTISSTINAGELVNIGSTTGAAAPVGAADDMTLDNISNVDTTGVADGNCLVYDNASGNWEDGSCAVPLGGLWTAGAGDDIYYNSGSPNVGIGTASPAYALDVVGDIQFTGILIDASDARLKTDITPLQDDANTILTRLDQIGGYSFRMKDDESGQIEYGVMAQEVERVFPELVQTADDEMGTKSVNYLGLIAPLIEASKELKAENEELKTAISEKEERMAAMEARMETFETDMAGLKAFTGFGISKASAGLLMLMLLALGGATIVLIRRRQA